jgi:alpha-N-arabinofuranosidase
MMNRVIKFLKLLFAILLFTINLLGQKREAIVVKVNKPVATIKSTMWGIFFEDVNFAADGGIYAELVKNRSFEFAKPCMGWRILKPDTTLGLLILNQVDKKPENPRFLRVTIAKGESAFGISNAGFRGMGIKKDLIYHFTVLTRQSDGSSSKMRIELVNSKGEVIGTAKLMPEAKEWEKLTVCFVAKETEPKAKINIWFEGEGSLDVDMISLFPNDTWKNRPAGLRADLVQFWLI